jgi:hypothetical protein
MRLRRLWDEHTRSPFPATGDDPQVQEVALYSTWLGSIVVAALRRGTLDATHAKMLQVRRKEGNRELFRAAGELGDPMRSYVARLITLEEIVAGLPVDK